MPFRERSGTGTLFFGSTGEKLMNVSNADIVTECDGDVPKYLSGGEISGSFTAHDSTVSKQLLDLADTTYEIGYNTEVQIRKHHKRRINKKWLKRYGYKMVYHSIGRFRGKTQHDGSLTFIRVDE